jgi:hypothetical protein
MNSVKRVLIPTEGKCEIVTNTFKECRKVVGGWIELHVLGDSGFCLYANEDAKEQNLPMNRRATTLAVFNNFRFLPGDFFRGNVYVIGRADADGEETSLSDADARAIMLSLGEAVE